MTTLLGSDKEIKYSTRMKMVQVATYIALGAVLIWFFLIGLPALEKALNPPELPATDAECKKVFDDTLQGFFGPSMDGVIKRCSGRLEPLVATVSSNYKVVGSSLQIGDAVYSSHGMVVENSSANFRDIGVVIPDVRISVSGKSISLLFGRKADADKAFAEISALISHVKN